MQGGSGGWMRGQPQEAGVMIPALSLDSVTGQKQSFTGQGLPCGQASVGLLRPRCNNFFFQNSHEEGRTLKELGN